MTTEEIKTEAAKRYSGIYDGDKEEGFIEGTVYGINETLDKVSLLLQDKFGHDDIYFKEARKILLPLKID